MEYAYFIQLKNPSNLIQANSDIEYFLAVIVYHSKMK